MVDGVHFLAVDFQPREFRFGHPASADPGCLVGTVPGLTHVRANRFSHWRRRDCFGDPNRLSGATNRRALGHGPDTTAHDGNRSRNAGGGSGCQFPFRCPVAAPPASVGCHCAADVAGSFGRPRRYCSHLRRAAWRPGWLAGVGTPAGPEARARHPP